MFQNGDTPESGRTVTKTYKVDLDALYWDDDQGICTTPWYEERNSVRVVNFKDKISPTSTGLWFYDLQNMERVDNIQNLDTSRVTTMRIMFANCVGLTTLDVSHFDTTNVMDMSSMFWNCIGLTALDVSHFNTANVTNVESMFTQCHALTELDLSHFNTKNVTSMACMFMNCDGLTELDLSHFDTANVTNMDGMFYGCHNLTTLDVSSFDTRNVTDMSSMFHNCTVLTTLDVSCFDTANVTDTAAMFSDCFQLKTLYASEKFTVESVPETLYKNSHHMFWNCYALVGGNGTKCDNNHTDKKYARIDGGTSEPGYFTRKD